MNNNPKPTKTELEINIGKYFNFKVGLILDNSNTMLSSNLLN